MFNKIICDKLQSNQGQLRMKINSTAGKALYSRNASATFFGGYVSVSDAEYAAPFIWLAHTFLLPLSLTLGAGAKTYLDVSHRKELSDEALANLKSHLGLITNEQFDQLVENAIGQPVDFTYDTYDLTIELQEVLKDLNMKAEKSREKIFGAACEQFKIKKEHSLEEEAKTRLFGTNNSDAIAIKIAYTITTEDINQINNDLASNYLLIEGSKRSMQEYAIFSYIGNILNAGSRMENFLNDNVEASYKSLRK